MKNQTRHLSLIEIMTKEIEKPKEDQSKYLNSIWFMPESGRFLFNDRFIHFDFVDPLIQSKTIVFKGIEIHQGERILRYVLS